MQALRFGAFSPAQQATLDQLTGGKNFRDAALDPFQPLSAQETQDFADGVSEAHGFFGSVLDQVTPDEFEKEVQEELDYFLSGEARKDLTQELAQITDPDEKREFLINSVSAPAAGILKALKQWPHTPTDKTFEAVQKLVELTKEVLKF